MSDDVYDVYDDARKELSSNTTYPIPYREEYAETRSVFHLHHRSNSVKRGVKLHACVCVCIYIYNSLLFFLQFLFLSFDAFGVLSTLKRFGGIDDTTLLFIASKTQHQHDNGCFVVSMVLVFEHQREE